MEIFIRHRFSNTATIKIYCNFIKTYLQMQHVALKTAIQQRTRSQLFVTCAILNQVLTFIIHIFMIKTLYVFYSISTLFSINKIIMSIVDVESK